MFVPLDLCDRIELAVEPASRARVEFGLELFLGNLAPRFFSLGEAAWLVGAGAVLGATGSVAALFGWRS